MRDVSVSFDFSSLSSEEISTLLANQHLQLTVDEALFIQNSLLKRPPTYAECVLWSIQGSEHCSYKSSRKHLNAFVTKAPQVILGPSEDAGVVAVAQDKKGLRYGIVVSHESHNHPSQLVPYEGAATGVGGNVRDVACMGAEVIAVADGLRFGDIRGSKTQWIADGVGQGIAGYANPLGIPNLAGDVYFDESYNQNCLVTIVSLGIVREDHIIHSFAPTKADARYQFILVGKPTDNSGFGGAAFASTNLSDAKIDKNKGAVQEPNAFLQRHILKANYALFAWLQEQNLINSVGFKDLGAGGIACASVELADASGFGADINIDMVPTSIEDLEPAVILCSETQERFMWVVPETLVDTILSHYNERFALPEICNGARATVIGRIRTDGLYQVRYHEQTLVSAKASDITQGILYDRPYVLSEAVAETHLVENAFEDLSEILFELLAHENIASRSPIYERYDKQVQGRIVLERGRGDAGVLAPFNEDKYPEEIRKTAVALALAHNPRYHKISAYWGAVNAVIEAMRRVISVGARPLALSDCLCFGNPERPLQMGFFVESVRGIVDASKVLDIPIISGNVSLYNETDKGAIPPSPMISCLGNMPNFEQVISPEFKSEDSIICLIGERLDECGGSVYYQLKNELGSQLPKPNLKTIANELRTTLLLMEEGLVCAAHLISKGGLAVALAEMSFTNQIGIHIDLPIPNSNVSSTTALFTETGGFVLEIAKSEWPQVEEILNRFSVNFSKLGHTLVEPYLCFGPHLKLPIHEAMRVYENGLREKL